MKEDRVLVMRFEGVVGSPTISGIGIRRAPNASGILIDHHDLIFSEDKYLYLILNKYFDKFCCNYNSSAADK